MEYQIFIKPVGALCNLQCSYCYYTSSAALFREGFTVMSYDLLELCIRQHLEIPSEKIIMFSWHGGEPMLAGIDFYRHAVELQKRWCPAGKRVINGIQTNGTLLDEAWCKFMSNEGFQVGLSLDGPEILHNRFRKGKDGAGSFRKVLHGFDLMIMHDMDPEILCVVNAENVNFPLEVYRFFRQLGVSFITFIPLAERCLDNHVSDRSVTAAAFGDFLCAIFDEWKAHDIGKIKVQIFEEALRIAFNQDHTLCIFKKECGRVPVLEHNGNVYSCDHFVDEPHYLGNIQNGTLIGMINGPKQRDFGKSKVNTLPAACRICEVLAMCNGECIKNRFAVSADGETGLNYFCEGYRKFFNHCKPFIEAVTKAAGLNARYIK